eukprot:jgi/Ulvmu1/1997/UM012_0159.1
MRKATGVSCKQLRFVRFPAPGRFLQRLQHVRFLSSPGAPDASIYGSSTLCRALAGDVAPASRPEASGDSTKVQTGRVVSYDKDGLVLVEGLNDSAQMGTVVALDGGAQGVLLWWHDVDVCSVIITNYEDVELASLMGTSVKCVLASKPAPIPAPGAEEGSEVAFSVEFEKLSVPAGSKLRGQVLDHLCRPLDPQADAAGSMADATPVPLMNGQVAMGDREVISEPLYSGVLAIDVMTPLAHGCAMLATGPERQAVTDILLRVACNLASPTVHVIYAASCSSEALRARVDLLRAEGALPNATVIATGDDAPRAQQYAALCAAMAVGEAVRDDGGHAVVVGDSADCMVQLWKAAVCMAHGSNKGEADELVEVDGMLVSAAAAERRKFFSALLQRAAKRRRDQGGGALTLVLGMLGVPASGDKTAATASGSRAPKALDAYKHLSPELKVKMAAALAAKAEAAAAAAVPQAGSPEHRASMLLEEFMSIADGQAVLRAAAAGERPLTLDCTTSLSRLGSRAYPPALKDLAPKVRLELTQAEDARRYAADGGASAACTSAARRPELLAAALSEGRAGRCSLPEAAALLWLLVRGNLDAIAPENLWDFWPGAWQRVQEEAADAVKTIEETKQLTAEAKAGIKRVVQAML